MNSQNPDMNSYKELSEETKLYSKLHLHHDKLCLVLRFMDLVEYLRKRYFFLMSQFISKIKEVEMLFSLADDRAKTLQRVYNCTSKDSDMSFLNIIRELAIITISRNRC